MIEEYNKMVIKPKGLIAIVIPIKGTIRKGDFMAIKKGETTTRTRGVPMVTKTGDATVTRKGVATATSKTGDVMATKIEEAMAISKIGETMVEMRGTLTGAIQLRGNAVQGWGSEPNLAKEAKAEGIIGIGATSHNTRATGNNREGLERR